MEIYVKIHLVFVLSFFLALSHDFVIYIGFTHVAASYTATDDSQIRSHIEYLIH